MVEGQAAVDMSKFAMNNAKKLVDNHKQNKEKETVPRTKPAEKDDNIDQKKLDKIEERQEKAAKAETREASKKSSPIVSGASLVDVKLKDKEIADAETDMTKFLKEETASFEHQMDEQLKSFHKKMDTVKSEESMDQQHAAQKHEHSFKIHSETQKAAEEKRA